MRVPGEPSCHLTYCTSIHPGESYAQTRANLERHVLEVKRRVCPDAPFGVGLRVSAAAARDLSQPGEAQALRAFLDAHGLYVFTLNGFPYGAFHATRVKEHVYLPDWRDRRRLHYSDQLAVLLSTLLPDGLDGSVSTVPGCYKAALGSPGETERMADHILEHAAFLQRLRERSGRTVSLALEPEPSCVLETVDEAVEFFERRLFSNAAIAGHMRRTGLGRSEAEASLRRHLGLCFDTCHAAVEFEDARQALAKLSRAGIGLKKIQLSSGLRLVEPTPAELDALSEFAEEVYLHQTVVRSQGRLVRHADLADALRATTPAGGAEWRVHFHVPIFLDSLPAFSSTQGFLAAVLDQQRGSPISPHLEIETYTWDVLPEGLRNVPVEEAIAREFTWALGRLAG